MLIVFIILVLGFLIKWLVAHVDKIMKDANEDKMVFNKIMEKHERAIDGLTKQIETNIKNNDEAHRMQKLEHCKFETLLRSKLEKC